MAKERKENEIEREKKKTNDIYTSIYCLHSFSLSLFLILSVFQCPFHSRLGLTFRHKELISCVGKVTAC